MSAISVEYPGSLLDVRHQLPDDVHEVERALSLAAAAGYPRPAGDDGRLAVREVPVEPPFDEPYVVVHPGASVPARAWSAERHADLIDLLVADGYRVVVSGGAGERELCERVCGPDRPEVLNLAGSTGLGGLAGILRGAQALVCGNTGPAHLAAAVGTPVASLFAPTVPAVRWRPYGVPHELLFVDVPCAGCRARVCPVAGHPCLEAVEPAQALAALRRLARVPAPVGAAS